MKMDWFHKTYDSIEEAWADRTEAHGALRGDESWDGGVRTWEEMRVLVEQGWAAGVDRARKMRMDMDDFIESLGLEGMVPVEEYDVSGAYVDVGAYCEGEPECMVEYTEQVMPNSRVVRVVVQINYLQDVNAWCAMRRGVAIAAVVDAVEAAGLQCELWAVDCTNASGYGGGIDPDADRPHIHRHAILVKRPGEPMPLDRMALAIGHPAFYRGLSFALRGTIKGNMGGASVPIPKDIREPGELVVPLLSALDQSTHFSSDTDASAWACETFGSLITEALEEYHA